MDEPNLNDQRHALMDLLTYTKAALEFRFMKDMTPEEREDFKWKHPGAHFVIGDFEIKCLNPKKYNL